MNATIRQSQLHINAVASKSKSMTHRLMIAYALSNNKVCDEWHINCDDTFCTHKALESLLSEQNDVVVCVGESGSTLRFLLPIACALQKRVKFIGNGDIAKRPIKDLIVSLREMGANIDSDTLPFTVDKGLHGGQFEIVGDISSQYISGLLFALPLLFGDSTIKISGTLKSKRYVDMTLNTLHKSGIQVDCKFDGDNYCEFYVKGNQDYQLFTMEDIEGDWSSSAFLLSAGVLTGSANVCGLDENSNQADKKIVDILRDMGAKISVDGAKFCVEKSNLHSIDIDVGECIDLAPIVAVLCANASGISTMCGIDRLRYKESDRLQSIIDMLDTFGIECREFGDYIEIKGGISKPCEYQSNDHRMVMSAVIMALCITGECQIGEIECISKSYPRFMQDLGLIDER